MRIMFPVHFQHPAATSLRLKISLSIPTPSHLSSLRLEVVVVEPEGELRRVSGRLHTSHQAVRHHSLHEMEIRQAGWDLLARTGDCVDTEANPDGIENTATKHPSLLSDTSNG